MAGQHAQRTLLFVSQFRNSMEQQYSRAGRFVTLARAPARRSWLLVVPTSTATVVQVGRQSCPPFPNSFGSRASSRRYRRRILAAVTAPSRQPSPLSSLPSALPVAAGPFEDAVAVYDKLSTIFRPMSQPTMRPFQGFLPQHHSGGICASMAASGTCQVYDRPIFEWVGPFLGTRGLRKRDCLPAF
jgi:hypothetical protein